MTVFRGDTLEVGPATRPCNCPRVGPSIHARGPLCRWDVDGDESNLFRGVALALVPTLIFWAIILYPWWKGLLR